MCDHKYIIADGFEVSRECGLVNDGSDLIYVPNERNEDQSRTYNTNVAFLAIPPTKMSYTSYLSKSLHYFDFRQTYLPGKWKRLEAVNTNQNYQPHYLQLRVLNDLTRALNVPKAITARATFLFFTRHKHGPGANLSVQMVVFLLTALREGHFYVALPDLFALYNSFHSSRKTEKGSLHSTILNQQKAMVGLPVPHLQVDDHLPGIIGKLKQIPEDQFRWKNLDPGQYFNDLEQVAFRLSARLKRVYHKAVNPRLLAAGICYATDYILSVLKGQKRVIKLDYFPQFVGMADYSIRDQWKQIKLLVEKMLRVAPSPMGTPTPINQLITSR